MPQGDGLGFLSTDIKDLYRKLESPLALKDGFELKPPYKVPKYSKENGDAAAPCGSLHIKMRLADEELSITDIAKGAFMKYAIAESLGETIMAIVGVYCAGSMVSYTEEVTVTDVQYPFNGTQVWQFCDFRFDYKIQLTPQDSERAAYSISSDMTNFESTFCQALETKFRQIYHLTILGLKYKQHALMDGTQWYVMSALYKAAQQNNTEEMRNYMGSVDLNAYPDEQGFVSAGFDPEFKMVFVELGRTALLGAAEEGHVEAMKMLIENKADINFKDKAGFSALYLAAGSPNAEKAVACLLDMEKVSVNLPNKSGYTALHNACGSGESGAVKALIEAKADLNIKSKGGAAPVHVAVLNDQPGVLETLQGLKANFDMPAFGGNTPVHEAVMQNNPDIIQKLFELKADINIESGPEHKFSTPLKMAMDRKRKKAAAKLQSLGALEKIDGLEYEDSTDGEFEPTGTGDYKLNVKGRFTK